MLLLFDEDGAGRKGAAEARERLREHVEVRCVRLGAEGQQPDSLSPEQLRALIERHAGREVAA